MLGGAGGHHHPHGIILPFAAPTHAGGGGSGAVAAAHMAAQRAESAEQKADFMGAVSAHAEASRMFLASYEEIESRRDRVTAAGLLLLSQAHARKAHVVEMALGGQTARAAPAREWLEGCRGSQKLPSSIADSILGRPASARVREELDGGLDAAERRVEARADDLLELEKRLGALGLSTGLRSGSGLNAAKPVGAAGGPSPRYLSSTLGESFCLLAPSQTKSPLFAVTRRRTALAPSLPSGAAAASSSKAAQIPSQQPAVVMSEVVQSHHNLQAEITRLLECVHRLSNENATLVAELEDSRKAKSEVEAARMEMQKFRALYRRRYSDLRGAVEDFREKQKQATSSQQETLQLTSSRVVALERQLKKAAAELSKKDATIQQFSEFYKGLKENAAKKQAFKKAQEAASARTRL